MKQLKSIFLLLQEFYWGKKLEKEDKELKTKVNKKTFDKNIFLEKLFFDQFCFWLKKFFLSKKNLLTKKITKKKFFPTKKIPNFRRLKILNITIKINIDENKKNQEKARKENCGNTNANTNTRRWCNFY